MARRQRTARPSRPGSNRRLAAPPDRTAILKFRTKLQHLQQLFYPKPEITNAARLKPDVVPAGIDGDTVWKLGEILFMISILPKDKAPEIGELTDLIIGGDAQQCRGDLFTAATLDVIETVGVARAYTNCQTQQVSASSYYLAIPRKQGGLYLLTTMATGVEITPTLENNAKEIDGRVRAFIMTALAKI